jgi:hypothetical protein
VLNTSTEFETEREMAGAAAHEPVTRYETDVGHGREHQDPIETIDASSQEEEEEEDDYESETWSDSDVGEALDWLDATEGPISGVSASGGGTAFSGGSAAPRRPNAHGGVLSRPLQPMSNRSQRFTSHIRADPLEVI